MSELEERTEMAAAQAGPQLANKEATMDSNETLSAHGTPWAATYRGSGRFTGRLTDEPTRCDNGDVAPGWSYVGYMTMEEFEAAMEWEEHDYFHSPLRGEWRCRHCQGQGWVPGAK